MSKLQPNHVSLGSISESTRNSISAATGDLCFNTTSGVVEYYDGSSWKAISTTISEQNTYIVISYNDINDISFTCKIC